MTVHSTARLRCRGEAGVLPRRCVHVTRHYVVPHPGSIADKPSSVSQRDIVAFLFVDQDCQEAVDAENNADCIETVVPKRPQPQYGFASIEVPPFDLIGAASMLLPAALAAHSGFAPGGAGVAVAVLPMMMPFSMPQLGASAWLPNKRAVAFHRACVLTMYGQGALTLLRLAQGDLIGGVYMGVQSAMGFYALQPGGQSYFPYYIMICGFNGVLGLLQVFQSFQGVPVHYLPWSKLLPPAVSLGACYFGYQFCREVRAIAEGGVGGDQNSCFVSMMNQSWCPAWTSNFVGEVDEYAENGPNIRGLNNMGGGSFAAQAQQRMSVFGGDGHRLGED